MEATGAFDKIWIDGLGNLLGQVGKPGKGKKLIAIDAHVDTVGVGNRDEWKHDPYKGKVADGKVWGRGAGDQEGAIPAMVYAAKILRDLKVDVFLGKGTITVSYIDCKTPSLCAVPGQAYIHLDRRLTVGDTKKSAVAEVKGAVKRAGVEAKVEVLRYARPSYTGLTYETEKYFPMWCEAEVSLPVRAAVKTHHNILGKPPIV